MIALCNRLVRNATKVPVNEKETYVHIARSEIFLCLGGVHRERTEPADHAFGRGGLVAYGEDHLLGGIAVVKGVRHFGSSAFVRGGATCERGESRASAYEYGACTYGQVALRRRTECTS